MKHLKPINNFLKEEKDNDINSLSFDKQVDFSNDKLDSQSFNKVDFYYLEDNVDKSVIREMYDLIYENEYRAFATFSENIKYFEEMPCTLIALVNYPPNRFNKRTILDKLEDVKKYDFVDEIEFPWSIKYNSFGVEFWRNIILDFSNRGVRIRPMVEFGIYSIDDIKYVVDFFKKINIMTIMTSSGLYPQITTLEKWEDIKDLIPNKWDVKIGGVLTINDINKFIKSDVDLAATTLSFKSKYKYKED